MDIWPVVHSERKALADDLTPLDARQWSTSSLCSNWTIRDVLAHMTATASMSPASFFGRLAGSGFSFNKVQAKGIASTLGGSPSETLAGFAAASDSTGRPPGPMDTILGETLVHSEDIRRPLGITHQYPIEALVQTGDFFKRSNLLIGTKRRITGLTLRATDTEWSSGTGPEVRGTMLDLLMAMTGRKAAAANLTGDGADTLRSRP